MKLWPFWTTEYKEIDKITHAYLIAERQHRNQKRKYTNLPYITHPIRVALAVATYPQVKLSWICAAFLHDCIEDTVNNKEEKLVLCNEIKEMCGEEVLELVKELTNEEHDKKIPREKRKRMDWNRLSKVSKPAKIIKMFDRIDNLMEMTGSPNDFKSLYLRESLELLKVVGDADKDVAYQLESLIKREQLC